VTPSNRKGLNNLIPEHMGDEWLYRLDYAAGKHGLTGKDARAPGTASDTNGFTRCA